MSDHMTAEQAYDLVSSEYNDTFHKPYPLAEDQWVMNELLDIGMGMGGQKVIDLGCGDGLLLDYLDIASDNYTGVDISQGMLDAARRKHPKHTFVKGDMEKLPVANLSQDIAVSLFGSMSYTLHFAQAVREMLRVLKVGGRFYLMLFSDRYQRRPTYILNTHGIEVDRYFVRERDVRMFFDVMPVNNLSVRGMALGLAESLRNWPLKRETFLKLLYFERRLNLRPDRYYNLIVTGTRA